MRYKFLKRLKIVSYYLKVKARFCSKVRRYQSLGGNEMEYTIDNLLKVLSNRGEVSKDVVFLRKVRELIKNERITYLKNLFRDDKPLEVYSFDGETVIGATRDEEDKNIIIEKRRYTEITLVEYREDLSTYRNRNRIEIVFSNKSTILLNNEEDTNEYHAASYAEIIQEIFQQL